MKKIIQWLCGFCLLAGLLSGCHTKFIQDQVEIYAPEDPELFRDIYNSLLNTKNSAKADTYFILKDFRSYAEAQKRVEEAYKNQEWWAKAALLNTACSGKFSSDRTIEEYVKDIWHLDKVKVEL